MLLNDQTTVPTAINMQDIEYFDQTSDFGLTKLTETQRELVEKFNCAFYEAQNQREPEITDDILNTFDETYFTNIEKYENPQNTGTEEENYLLDYLISKSDEGFSELVTPASDCTSTFDYDEFSENFEQFNQRSNSGDDLGANGDCYSSQEEQVFFVPPPFQQQQPAGLENVDIESLNVYFYNPDSDQEMQKLPPVNTLVRNNMDFTNYIRNQDSCSLLQLKSNFGQQSAKSGFEQITEKSDYERKSDPQQKADFENQNVKPEFGSRAGLGKLHFENDFNETEHRSNYEGQSLDGADFQQQNSNESHFNSNYEQGSSTKSNYDEESPTKSDFDYPTKSSYQLAKPNFSYLTPPKNNFTHQISTKSNFGHLIGIKTLNNNISDADYLDLEENLSEPDNQNQLVLTQNESLLYDDPMLSSGSLVLPRSRQRKYTTSSEISTDCEDGCVVVSLQCKWENCYQVYETQGSLVRHIEKTHVELKRGDEFTCFWFNCPRNNKPFNARYKLLIHMRVHSGEKPNKCPFKGCNKAFSRLENLKIHQRSHTGERPYLCQFPNCTKSFSNSSDRAKHQRTHYDTKPYACQVYGCTKKYTDPSSLRKHVKNHTPEEQLQLKNKSVESKHEFLTHSTGKTKYTSVKQRNVQNVKIVQIQNNFYTNLDHSYSHSRSTSSVKQDLKNKLSEKISKNAQLYH